MQTIHNVIITLLHTQPVWIEPRYIFTSCLEEKGKDRHVVNEGRRSRRSVSWTGSENENFVNDFHTIGGALPSPPTAHLYVVSVSLGQIWDRRMQKNKWGGGTTHKIQQSRQRAKEQRHVSKKKIFGHFDSVPEMKPCVCLCVRNVKRRLCTSTQMTLDTTLKGDENG